MRRVGRQEGKTPPNTLFLTTLDHLQTLKSSVKEGQVRGEPGGQAGLVACWPRPRPAKLLLGTPAAQGSVVSPWHPVQNPDAVLRSTAKPES